MDDLLLLGSGANNAMSDKGYLEITVDSVAAEVVAPQGFPPDYQVKASPVSQAGSKCRTANGNVIVNQSEKRVRNAPRRGRRTQNDDVPNRQRHETARAGRAHHGARTPLRPRRRENAYILHKAANRKVPLYKKGKVFVMRANMMPPSATQKENIAVLGELGFTRGED